MLPHEPLPEETRLTLHTLYRVLTRRDFPVHSWRVFPASHTQGVTLLSFWYAFLKDALPEETDIAFLDPVQDRNRNASRLLNGSGSSRMMAEWFEALSARLDLPLLSRMTDAWMQLLQSWQYSPRALTMRLNAYLEGVRFEDTPAGNEQTVFFHGLRQDVNDAERLPGESPVPLLFLHGLTLSWLTLHALYATRPGDPAINRFRIRFDRPAPAVYALCRSRPSGEPVQMLSARQCVLCAPALPSHRFFGREKEAEQALELMRNGGKLAVTGLGGIGKTEFVRQLLPLLTRELGYRRLAFVQYESSLAESFAVAFPALRASDGEQVLSLARELLEDPEAGKTLLLVDNVDQYPNRDPALSQLITYGCDILLTSRLTVPESFPFLELAGLDPRNADRLFRALADQADASPAAVDFVCGFSAGHPLALSLFGRLCHARFWTPERLADHLRQKGFAGLSFIRQAAPLRLTEVFRSTFDTSSLSPVQARLLITLAILPSRYRLPEALLPWAMDSCETAEEVADQCELLFEMGWLLRSADGYSIHPLIAETVRMNGVNAEHFPRLWQYAFSHAVGKDPAFHQALVSMLVHTSVLSLTAVRCLAVLEQRLGFIPYIRLPEELYTRHRRFLDEHGHVPSDDADWALGQGIRDIVVLSRQDRLSGILRSLLRLPGGVSALRNRECAYTLLEYASFGGDLKTVDAFFAAMRPADENSPEMADHLISYSVRQRRADHDAEGALASLIRADQLLREIGEGDTSRRSNLDYRRAFCLLDLGRTAEARPLLENCLRILRLHGLPEDSAEMLSTRSTYAVVLYQLDASLEAAAEFRALQVSYQRLGRDQSGEYAKMMNNYACLLDHTGRFPEAARVMEDVLSLDEKLILPDDITATHLRNAALFLAHAGNHEKPLPLAERALRLRESVYGQDSPWFADAQAVYAFSLFLSGETAQAAALIGPACEKLESAWGPDHRHTKNARKIQALLT